MARGQLAVGPGALLVALAILAHPALAQDRVFFPSRDLLPSLLAGPRDPVNAGRLVLNGKSPNAYGHGFEGEAAFGIVLPVLKFAGSTTRDAFLGGLEAAVFGRFSFHSNERDLITTDWILTVPFVLHRGDHWVRARYFHVSGHLGDEYGQRFGVEAFNYGRDAVDALGFVQATDLLAAYGGGTWAYTVHPNDAERWSLRFGAELLDRSTQEFVTPYAAADVQLDQEVGWDARVNVQVGALFPGLVIGRDFRLAVEFLAGPSPQGQFVGQEVAHFALGIYVEP
jgi:hypothetical protein